MGLVSIEGVGTPDDFRAGFTEWEGAKLEASINLAGEEVPSLFFSKFFFRAIMR